MLWIFAICIIGILLYFLLGPQRYWSKRGVIQGWPIPLVGDNYGTLIQMESFIDVVLRVYSRGTNERYVGAYQFNKPLLVIKDPELMKQITVKDFDHFVDHSNFLDENVEPLWANNLFSLKGQRWRDMRATLSPSFTSSKMKFMFTLMTECAENLSKYFLKMDKEKITVEMKDTFTRFTNDVIASTAFGVHCDSLEHKDNEFYVMGKETTNFGGFLTNLKFCIILLSPKVAKFLRISIFTTKVSNFFRNLIKQTIRMREEKGIVRPDMIHLLLEARKGQLKKYEENQEIIDTGFATAEDTDVQKNSTIQKQIITDDDITAQALIFFFAGFDSVSGLMCFTSYELAVNQEVQKRLIEEIDEVRSNCNGKLTYEALLKMKYMDMVISETLRKWPNAVAVDRACTKPYTIQPIDTKEKPIHLAVGDLIWIPIIAMHRDPRYYPNPDKFDPERFNDENKDNIKPYTYIPFGVGPRNCIGSRFALLETKTVFFYLLSNFEIHPSAKTTIPIKISKKQFNPTAEGGFWFDLKRR